MPIAALRFRRMQASKHGGLRVIQIRKAKLGFPPSQFPFLDFAPHGGRLPTAGPMRMRQLRRLVDAIAVYRDLLKWLLGFGASYLRCILPPVVTLNPWWLRE